MSNSEKEENQFPGEQEEGEEGEEEEDDDKSKNEKINNSDENINIQQETSPPKTHSYYQILINQLKEEILILKNNNNKAEKSSLEEDYEILQSELNGKISLLNKLKSTNKKQKSSYESLSKRLEQEEIKQNKIKEKYLNSMEFLKQKDFLTSEIDKRLDKSTLTMRELRMENQELLKKLDENEDYANNINLEIQKKDIKEQLQQKNNEINILIKLLEPHILCKEEQKKLKEEINTLNSQIKNTKKNIQKIKENNAENLIFSNKNKMSSSNSLVSKKIMNLNKSTPNIYLNKNNNNENNNILSLPLILNKKNKKEETILSNEFYKNVKNEFKGNEVEYNFLIKKIKSIEKNRNKTEKKNKNEINEQNWKIESLDEKFKVMKLENKHSDFNTKMLKLKLNNLWKINKKELQKLKEVEKDLEKVKNIMKNKNDEISKILKQINNVRTLVSLNFIKIEDSEIQKYIEKIKKHKRSNSNDGLREESKINNKVFSTKLKKEESITTDFEKLKNNNNKNENSQKRNKILKNKK